MSSSDWQPQKAADPPQGSSTELPRSNTDEASTSPRPPSKAVSFHDANISPLMIGKEKELDQKDHLDLDKAARQYTASLSRKRLSGRPSVERLSSQKLLTPDGNPSLSSLLSDSSADSHGHRAHENLIKQVGAWLKHERNRRHARRAKRKASKDEPHPDGPAKDAATQVADQPTSTRARSGSDSSHEGFVALDQLAHILEKTLAIKPAEAKKRTQQIRRLSTGLKRHSAISLDSDYFETVDQLVPSCDVILDNSKTMAYNVDEPPADPATDDSEGRACQEAWSKFRFEILRIIHTLKLKGWRRVPMDQSDELVVQRLSGALTNAVYVVSPPENLPTHAEGKDGTPKPKNPPPKLLLRIYGPQVEHLIDRESELQILSRLARKRIGPCLLGTFQNGRFEEFLNAKALNAKDLRNPETSKQIAKRMRELHEGIDLLKEERDSGPFVYQNWDKWVDRCEHIVTWLDQQVIESQQNPNQSGQDRWKKRGFVCGMEWPKFRQMIENYRAWLEKQYGGQDKINERMVFSHNDTQYGNILRMEPEGESPLLLPANQHKQLVVIDFEYANANLPGLEFANHFTEWTYNYHATEGSWRCNTKYYPTVEEQHRFIRAYLLHNPSFKSASGRSTNQTTPRLGPLPSSGSTCALAATATPTTISAFMLDSRAPPGEKYEDQEAQAEQDVEEEVRRLMAETKLWRLANSAQWVAWGIVQAQIPGMPNFETAEKEAPGEATEGATVLEGATKELKAVAEVDEKNGIVSKEGADENDSAKTPVDEDADLFKSQDEEEFDYLSYANDRALFLWGDALNMGIVKAEDLSEELKQRLKLVEY